MPADTVDVIVVGARCAGAPLARDLAQRGVSVCLVDRARFPSEVPSTHMIHPCGVARLRRLGLMHKLLETGAPPLERGAFVVDDIRLNMEPATARRFEAPWLCIRRQVLDQILLDAAADAGVKVLTENAVTELREANGAVCGVQTDGGEIRAQLVVGADGPSSVVARLTHAQEYHASPAGRLFLWGYFEGARAPEGYATLGRIGDVGFLAMPTDAGLFLAGVALPMHQRDACLADTTASLATGLQAAGEVGEFVRGASRVGPVRVMTRWHGYFREATGPGWVLVGDAGHFKDPTPAQGISDALRQGEKLAEAIEAGLGSGDLDARLRQWWRWRDQDAWEMYWFASDMGGSGNGPRIVTEMIRGLATERTGAERFLQLLNHEIAPSKVFSPLRALKAFATSAVAQPAQLRELTTECGTLIKQEISRQRSRRRLVHSP